MMKKSDKNVFLMEYIHPEARKLLEAHVNIISDMEKIAEADALINRNFTVDRELLERASRLKVIGVHGTGMDAIDLAEADRRGIEVFNTPGLNARSVAELNITLAMDLSRHVTEAAAKLKGAVADIKEDVDRKASHTKVGTKETATTSHDMGHYAGHEISGKTIGLIGVGTITKQTALMLQNGFGAKIVAWSRSLTKEQAKELDFVYCESMEEVFKSVDIIMMGLAATDETYHIIGAEELKLCKPTALFINTARGSLVDEKALYEALVSGKISGAASDVFEQEPVTSENPLVKLDNFIALPHLGANTDEALYRVGMAVVEGVLERLGVKG